jgi:hypothetical protein
MSQKNLQAEKYKYPNWEKMQLNLRRWDGCDMKFRTELCKHHMYPHLLQETTKIVPNPSISPRYDPHSDSSEFSWDLVESKFLSQIPNLLKKQAETLERSIKAHLKGSTITRSVQKKVHSYLALAMTQDFEFRKAFFQNEEFSVKILHNIGRLLEVTICDDKITRIPVHTAVESALNMIM